MYLFPKFLAEFSIGFIIYAACPSIRDPALTVNCRKVNPYEEVPHRHGKINPCRRQEAAPHVALDRVVPEEGKVSRSAPRRDSVADRIEKPADRLLSQGIEVGVLAASSSV